MAHSTFYRTYLKSDNWRERRRAALERAGYKCVMCHERDGLQVHHRTYERLGNEDPRDLVVLCRSCHFIADIERVEPESDWAERYKAPREKPTAQAKREHRRRETKQRRLLRRKIERAEKKIQADREWRRKYAT